MLKRKIAILIAGGLLGAQVTLTAAAQGAIPPVADDTGISFRLPAVDKYLEERAARNPNPTGARERPVFPRSTSGQAVFMPGVIKYHAEREREVRKQTVAAGDREIRIGSETKHVNVTHNETIRFVKGGDSFTHRFDGREFAVNLQKVAPAGLVSQPILAYVAPCQRQLGEGGG